MKEEKSCGKEPGDGKVSGAKKRTLAQRRRDRVVNNVGPMGGMEKARKRGKAAPHSMDICAAENFIVETMVAKGLRGKTGPGRTGLPHFRQPL